MVPTAIQKELSTHETAVSVTVELPTLFRVQLVPLNIAARPLGPTAIQNALLEHDIAVA
jgi:hypothetical protein